MKLFGPMKKDMAIAKLWLQLDIFPPESSLLVKKPSIKKLINQTKKQ